MSDEFYPLPKLLIFPVSKGIGGKKTVPIITMTESWPEILVIIVSFGAILRSKMIQNHEICSDYYCNNMLLARFQLGFRV